MTIDELINDFLQGKTSGTNGSEKKPGNIKIVDDKLLHYETALLQRKSDYYVLNYSRYSRTTGVLQNKLKEKIKNYEYKVVTKIPRGYCDDLENYKGE